MTVSHSAQQVQAHDRDRFLASLFVRSPARDALLALYAFNVELARVKEATREEMIGHIRYAWWQEAMDAVYEGEPTREQPVLQALAPLMRSEVLPRDKLMPLLDHYREHFMTSHLNADPLLDELSVALLSSLDAKTDGWRKARSIITAHRMRYGKKRNGWLMLKLLAAGLA